MLLLQTIELVFGPHVIARSLASQKNAGVGNLTFLHDTASRTCLFHALRLGSLHLYNHKHCDQTMVAANDNSCSISKSFVTQLGAKKVNGSFPLHSSPASFALVATTVCCVEPYSPRFHQEPPLKKHFGSLGMYHSLNTIVFLILSILCLHLALRLFSLFPSLLVSLLKSIHKHSTLLDCPMPS